MGLEARLNGAIGAVLGSINGQGGEREVFAQCLAEVLAQVGHVGKGMRMFLPKPFPHLLGAELLFADGGKELFELI